MYCPRCGYRQSSGELQFCPGCGFALAGVRQLLAANGVMPDVPRDDKPVKPSPRRRGINQGVVLWLIGMLLVPLVVLGGGEEAEAGAVAIILFGGGLARMLYALLVQSGETSSGKALAPDYSPPTFAPAPPPTPTALPASSASQIDSARRRTTGQLVPPPSVTDHTTRLLGKQ